MKKTQASRKKKESKRAESKPGPAMGTVAVPGSSASSGTPKVVAPVPGTSGSSGSEGPAEVNPVPPMPGFDMNAFLAAITSRIDAAIEQKVDGLQATVSTLREDVGERVAGIESHIMAGVATSLQQVRSYVDESVQRLDQQRDLGPLSCIPSAATLPSPQAHNPRRGACFLQLDGDMVTVENLGQRPLSDFIQHPQGAVWHYCYIRLYEEASRGEEKVQKEVVLFLTRKQNLP